MQVQETLNKAYLKASNVFAEHESMTDDEAINGLLDLIGQFRNDFNKLFIDLENVSDTLSFTLSENINKKELIIIRETLLPLYILSKKLSKSFTKQPKFRIGLKTVLSDFDVYISDFREFLDDLNKRINPNPEIDNLLKEISDC